MKTVLTIEESDNLIKLGVEPCFTLNDILGILQTSVNFFSQLNISLRNEKWTVKFISGTTQQIFKGDELIDALYQLLIWSISKNKIIIKNLEKKEIKKLNLWGLLKDYGYEGETFYNPLLGDVTVTLMIKCDGDRSIYIHRDGLSVDISEGKDKDGNLALFPSKDQRDWIKWKETKKNSKYSYLAVDKNGDEWIFGGKPIRKEDIWTFEESVVQLPRGSITKLIYQRLTWKDDCVRIKV